MFEIHVSKIRPPPELVPANFEELASRTEGFSGSDISILVRDAIMEPVRRCQVTFSLRPCLFMPFSPSHLHPVTCRSLVASSELQHDLAGARVKTPG